MNAVIEPRLLSGSVTPPPSKSQAHRVLMAQMLAGGGKISGLQTSEDIEATRRCLAALREPGEGLPELDCGESGSTLRFLIPTALALRGGGRFTGRGRLMERPLKPYFDMFDRQGIRWQREGQTLTVEGTLRAGTFSLPGNVSSQFVTGLLFALPLLAGDSVIELTCELESKGYADMTLQALRAFGVRAENRDYRQFFVPGGQTYVPHDVTVEADWSQAGFWYAAAALGGAVETCGMNEASAQGDRILVTHARALAEPGDREIDISDCPDLLPPLAVMAAVRQGRTAFVNGARLRMKESDRLASVCAMLRALGGIAEEGEDSLLVTGRETLEGGTVDGANDHRIVMAAAVAAQRCKKPVVITGAQAVNKSYPDFFEVYRSLGGMFRVI